MNKTLVGLVLIALLIGLGGGYALGYVIYQPQLQSLQDDLVNLTEDLNDLNGDITSIQNQMGSWTSEIAGLENQLTSLNSEIAELNSSLTNTQSSLTTLQNQLNSLQNQLVSLQNQLTSLNSMLSNLNSTVEEIENRSWHKVFSISSSSNFTSGTFELKGKEIRVMLSSWGQDALSWIAIGLFFSNGTLYSYWGFSGIYTVTNVEEDLMQSGQYYLDVISDQTDYDLILWDYY